MSYLKLAATLPPARDGASYISSYKQLMDSAQKVSKTDADTDYREDFVTTELNSRAVEAQLSQGSVSAKSGKWDDYDNLRTDAEQYQKDGNVLTAVESSMVAADTCDPDYPWAPQEGEQRMVKIDMTTNEILTNDNSVYDTAALTWNLSK